MTSPREIKLEDITQKAAEDRLWAIRAHAVQAYAHLEQALCTLFSSVAGMSNDVAGVIFFKITSTRVRNQIISTLIKKKYNSQYSIFWNSLFKEIGQVDQKRNEIVHWHAMISIGDGGVATQTLTLTPPNFWDHDANTPNISTPDLLAFIRKCDVFSRLMTMFSLYQDGQLDGVQLQTWRDIFLQAVVYPPPDNHPLSRFAKE